MTQQLCMQNTGDFAMNLAQNILSISYHYPSTVSENDQFMTLRTIHFISQDGISIRIQGLLDGDDSSIWHACPTTEYTNSNTTNRPQSHGIRNTRTHRCYILQRLDKSITKGITDIARNTHTGSSSHALLRTGLVSVHGNEVHYFASRGHLPQGDIVHGHACRFQHISHLFTEGRSGLGV